MGILYKSIHIINYENSRTDKRGIPDQFNAYINELIEFIDSNINVRYYRPKSQSTQVITNIKNIVSSIPKDTPERESKIEENLAEIAERLLSKEIEKQEQIQHLGINIKKGSIIQALIEDEDGKYKYLIAKVDHTNFVDDIDFTFKTGFSAKKQNIWKTCLFELNQEDDEIIINGAKVYLDGKAIYWTKEFLEIIEMRTDEINTKNVFDEISKVIVQYTKRKAPSDYKVLRNSLVGYLKQERHVEYNQMIEELFNNYTPTDNVHLNQERMSKMKERLKELPEVKQFDRQFTSAPTAITARISQTYRVSNSVEIKVINHIEGEDIKSYEENDGQRYIKIKTNNEEVYQIFK